MAVAEWPAVVVSTSAATSRATRPTAHVRRRPQRPVASLDHRCISSTSFYHVSSIRKPNASEDRRREWPQRHRLTLWRRLPASLRSLHHDAGADVPVNQHAGSTPPYIHRPTGSGTGCAAPVHDHTCGDDSLRRTGSDRLATVMGLPLRLVRVPKGITVDSRIGKVEIGKRVPSPSCPV